MLTIRLTFPAGRYHATPWGRHVNEGVAEWPPSPYRLLRALYDVWQRKCFDVPTEDIRKVLEALAETPPRFGLPAVTASHTRSYLNANSTDPSDKNLVFDPFLVFDQQHACFLTWPDLELDSGDRGVLERLLGHMNYLGRSESWVEAGLCDAPGNDDFFVSTAATDGDSEDGEAIRVACATPSSEYRGKRTWLDALTFSTANLLKEKASSPPLLKQVRYVLPQGAVETDPPRRQRRKEPEVDAVVLGLDARVFPLVTTTIEVAEQIRVRLMGAHKRRMEGDESKVSELFSGKDVQGKKRLDHGHVYILPIGNKDGRIDRILIRSPLRTFTQTEMDAVMAVQELWQRDDRGTIYCAVTWQGLVAACPVREIHTVVESATPFVPPRHWRKGRDFGTFLKDEVLRECRNHRIAEPEVVEQTDRMWGGIFHEVEYRRNRKKDPVRPGYALQLTFSAPVPAPFAIGYGAHFGLGQFRKANRLP
jgi:CRISPR-associated protein Csb2